MSHIERDDNVTVRLPVGMGVIKGRVCYKACQTGDCWIIEDEEGDIHYVQSFVEVIKRKQDQ